MTRSLDKAVDLAARARLKASGYPEGPLDTTAADRLESEGYVGLSSALRRRHDTDPAPRPAFSPDPDIEAIRAALGG